MELDLRDYLKIITKRLWLIITIVITATVATGVVNYLFLHPIYEASTKLIVNKTSESVNIQQLNSDVINTNLRLIDTYKEIIKTPAIMDLVAQQYPDLKLDAENLIKKVKVSSVNNTQVMTLIVQDPSYDKAANIANAVSKVFKQEIPKIMKVDNVSILNEAKRVDDPVPVKPNKNLNLAISFVVSLMTALGIVFLLEFLDDTIKSEADVEQVLGLPTLTAIARIKPEDLGSQGEAKKEAGGHRHVTINQ